MPTYKYIRINRINISQSINYASQIFFGFNIEFFGYSDASGLIPYGNWGTTFVNNRVNQGFSGNFISSATNFFSDPESYPQFSGDTYSRKSITYFAGQYNIADQSNNAFVLTPNDDIGFQVNYSSTASHSSGIGISFNNVVILYVGEQGQLHDVNMNLSAIIDIEEEFFQFFEETFYEFCQAWQADWLVYHQEITDFVNLYFYNTNYIYGNAAVGANMVFRYDTNPFLAINYNLRSLNRIFGYLNYANWSYKSVSYDSNGIGTVETVSNITWWDAILGYIDADSFIEAHRMELENQVLEQGLDDQYSGYLQALPYGVGLIDYGQNLFQYSNLYEKDGIDDSADSGYNNWYSAYNKFSIDAVALKDEVIVDFYSHNKIDFGGGLD